ncbi:MAG: hypothetical protein ACF8MF_06940 [Phycisphaerales bacterium JB052]
MFGVSGGGGLVHVGGGEVGVVGDGVMEGAGLEGFVGIDHRLACLVDGADLGGGAAVGFGLDDGGEVGEGEAVHFADLDGCVVGVEEVVHELGSEGVGGRGGTGL